MIKKMLITSSISCLLLSTSFADSMTEKPQGWYVEGLVNSVFGSESYLKNFQFNSNFLKNPKINAALGYKYKHFRAEGEYSYGYSSYWAGHFNNHTLGLNGYYDFDNSTIFSPYLGLGVRTTFYNFNSNYDDYSYPYNSSGIISPYVAGMAGVRAYLNNNLALDLKYTAGLFNTHRDSALGLGVVYHF